MSWEKVAERQRCDSCRRPHILRILLAALLTIALHNVCHKAQGSLLKRSVAGCGYIAFEGRLGKLRKDQGPIVQSGSNLGSSHDRRNRRALHLFRRAARSARISFSFVCSFFSSSTVTCSCGSMAGQPFSAVGNPPGQPSQVLLAECQNIMSVPFLITGKGHTPLSDSSSSQTWKTVSPIHGTWSLYCYVRCSFFANLQARLIRPQLQCLNDRPPVGYWQSRPGFIPVPANIWAHQRLQDPTAAAIEGLHIKARHTVCISANHQWRGSLHATDGRCLRP